MATSFAQTHSAAWAKVGIGTREKPGEIFPRFSQKNFDDLKADYVKQYGYTVRIPQWDDVVHLVPNAFKTPQQITAEKKEALVRILESPAPDWWKYPSTIMTWIDNIQDTSSIVFPLLSMLGRAAPKVFNKLIPIIGWIGTGFDLLNLLNALGRAPLTPMKSKRVVCHAKRWNPFAKSARLQRVGQIRNYKAGVADLLQVAQVTDQFTGAGLCLGGIMGAIYDSIFGAYRYATGKPIKFSTEPPDISNLSRLGSRGMQAAAAISSQGQVFLSSRTSGPT